MCRATRPKEEGRIAIVTNADRAAVDADGIGAKCFRRAGNRERGCRAYDRCGRRTAKSCGPDARRLASSLCGDVAANRCAHRSSRKATGAIVPRSPRRARHKPSTHCAGKARMSRLHLYAAVQISYSNLAQWTSGASRLPAFPAPFFQLRAKRSSKARANAPRGCGGVSAMKMRTGRATLSPRHCEELLRRSNPDCLRREILDCFAALAMTLLKHSRAGLWLSCPGRSAARSDALQCRGPCCSERDGFLGPGSAQQRLRVAARPRHARLERRTAQRYRVNSALTCP